MGSLLEAAKEIYKEHPEERYVIGQDFNTKDWFVYDNVEDRNICWADTEAEAKDAVSHITKFYAINEGDTVIMAKDNVVMVYNVLEGKYVIHNELLLPYPLKGRLRRVVDFEEVKTRYDDTQRTIAMNNNSSAVTSWLAGRVLLLSRENAKWLYNALGLEQVSTEEEKAKLASMCRAVSVNDTYWLKFGAEGITWSDVNIRRNSLNEVIAQIALHGKDLSLQGELTSPEFTTHGAYAKAWRRHEDGNLWLYKKGHNGNTESRIEVMVSNLLDKLDVEHCHYEAGEDEGCYVAMCSAMSTENLSILDGMDFESYCNVNGYDADKFMLQIDAESIYKMWIVDYLIANRDRHGQNWGFFYDSDTMEIKGCHPLYDHNNAFDTEWMHNPDVSYQFGNMTIKQAAHKAIRHVKIKVLAPITRNDFITDRQYNCFMSRAKELGIL